MKTNRVSLASEHIPTRLPTTPCWSSLGISILGDREGCHVEFDLLTDRTVPYFDSVVWQLSSCRAGERVGESLNLS